MPAAQYLLHVNSRPAAVSNLLWSEWYKDEHLPDLFNAKTCDRATLYEEIGHPFDEHPHHLRKFLALYQTKYEELLKTEEYQSIRTTSELFEKEGVNSNQIQHNGDFDARYYTLLQEYDPNEIGEKQPPQILAVYMNPEDPEDFEKWYREEHLPLLAKLPGYRRSLRYKISPKQTPLTRGSGPEEVQPYLAIHEIDDVNAFYGKEAMAANMTPWTAKHIEQSHPLIVRAFKLISSQGY